MVGAGDQAPGKRNIARGFGTGQGALGGSAPKAARGFLKGRLKCKPAFLTQYVLNVENYLTGSQVIFGADDLHLTVFNKMINNGAIFQVGNGDLNILIAGCLT